MSVASPASDTPNPEDDVWSSVAPLLPALWLPACCALFAACLYAIVGRLTYPYPLEWLEPDTPAIVARILSGLPLYCEPTIAYVSSMKTALYYYAVAAVSPAFGNTLLSGRLVSIASSFGVCLFIWTFVRREGGSWAWACFGVAFFLGAYHLSHDWYDIARLDSLFLLLTLAAAFALRAGRGDPSAATAGVLVAVAFFTKQAALFVMVPPLLLYGLTAPRRAIVAGSTAAILIAAGMLGLHLATDGWSTFFLVEVPRHAALVKERLVAPWTGGILAPIGLALLSSFGLVVGTWASDRGRSLFYCGLLGGALLAGLVGRANAAGSPNVFMPTFAVLAVTMPLALEMALRTMDHDGGKRWAVLGPHLVALLQLAILFYDPRQAIPSARDRQVSDQILTDLRSIGGGILIMDDRYFASVLAGASIGLDYSLTDVLQDQASPVTAKLQQSIIDALRKHQFAGVVDPPPFIRESIKLSGPLRLQSPAEERNRFTPRLEAYYHVIE